MKVVLSGFESRFPNPVAKRVEEDNFGDGDESTALVFRVWVARETEFSYLRKDEEGSVIVLMTMGCLVSV